MGTFETNIREAVSQQEWQARVDLAAFYRIVANYGWDDLLSIAAGKKLLRLGYGEVRAYRGGLADWRVRNLPTVKAGASSEP